MDVEKVVGVKRNREKQEDHDEQAFHALLQYLTSPTRQRLLSPHVFRIVVPILRIVLDILLNVVKIAFISNDMFAIIALPNGFARCVAGLVNKSSQNTPPEFDNRTL